MDILAHLSELLAQTGLKGPSHLRHCDEMDEALHHLRKTAAAGGPPDEPKDLQIEAVKRFWDTQRFESLREARLVSFGMCVRPWRDKRCLIEEPRRFDAALEGLEQWRPNPRQFRKCYQGLARSYFEYDGGYGDVPEQGKTNWRKLRDYLSENSPNIVDERINPDWVGCVAEHAAVFSPNPCATFAPDLYTGKQERVDSARRLLAISDGSWFTRELVIAQVRHACELGHRDFQDAVSRLLAMLEGNSVLSARGLELILNRYVKVPSTPEHQHLKLFSERLWGHPDLPRNETKWKGVSDEAQQMVSNWLKLEFIRLFFTKLAEDGIGDTRRVNFWSQYVPLIHNIRFALGSRARNPYDADFVELRKRLAGFTVDLEDANPDNNAFIMEMGSLVAVEFSGASNAFYGYSSDGKLPFDLSKPVRTPVDGYNSLKTSTRKLWMRHQDWIHGFSSWEAMFASELKDKFGLVPGRALPNRGARGSAIAPAPAPAPASQSPRASTGTAAPSSPPPPATTSSPASSRPISGPITPGTQRPGASQSVSPVNASPSPTGHVSATPSWPTYRRPENTTTSSAPAPTPPIPTTPAPTATPVSRPLSAPPPAPAAPRALPTPASEVYNDANLHRLASKFGGSVEDKRDRGGGLWIRIGDVPEARRVLRSWGFEFATGKGWWRRGD